MEKITLVSGANRGNGFEACRQLGQAGHQVILTSRDRTYGEEAAKELSKGGLNAQTRWVASAVKDYNIKVNAMCPGWVKTKMGAESARRSLAEGADTIVWLATLPASRPSGGFYKNRK